MRASSPTSWGEFIVGGVPCSPYTRLSYVVRTPHPGVTDDREHITSQNVSPASSTSFMDPYLSVMFTVTIDPVMHTLASYGNVVRSGMHGPTPLDRAHSGRAAEIRPLGIDDITNQYVLQGVHGGIVTLGLFIAVIVVAFRDTGRILQTSGQVAFRRAIAWALGVSLFIHTFIFFGTSYFGQIIMIWYLALAMIASMAPTRSEWSLVRNARVVLRKRQRRRTTGVRPITAPEASAT